MVANIVQKYEGLIGEKIVVDDAFLRPIGTDLGFLIPNYEYLLV